MSKNFPFKEKICCKKISLALFFKRYSTRNEVSKGYLRQRLSALQQ